MWGSCGIAIEIERYASNTYAMCNEETLSLEAPAHCHDDFNKNGVDFDMAMLREEASDLIGRDAHCWKKALV